MGAERHQFGAEAAQPQAGAPGTAREMTATRKRLWRPPARPAQALSALRRSLRERGAGCGPLRGASRAGAQRGRAVGGRAACTFR